MPKTDFEATLIRGLVRGLAQTERYTVMMFYADQLNPQEIAAVLEIPVTRVTSTLESFRGTCALAMERAAA